MRSVDPSLSRRRKLIRQRRFFFSFFEATIPFSRAKGEKSRSRFRYSCREKCFVLRRASGLLSPRYIGCSINTSRLSSRSSGLSRRRSDFRAFPNLSSLSRQEHLFSLSRGETRRSRTIERTIKSRAIRIGTPGVREPSTRFAWVPPAKVRPFYEKKNRLTSTLSPPFLLLARPLLANALLASTFRVEITRDRYIKHALTLSFSILRSVITPISCACYYNLYDVCGNGARTRDNHTWTTRTCPSSRRANIPIPLTTLLTTITLHRVALSFVALSVACVRSGHETTSLCVPALLSRRSAAPSVVNVRLKAHSQRRPIAIIL